MKKLLAYSIVIMLFIMPGCRQKSASETLAEPETLVDSILGIVVADTIIYDVIIRNDNPDDTWAEQRLSRLNHTSLTDNIFGMIYSGKAVAYNHETMEKMTPKQVQDMENGEGFDRENISMIQFKEVWYVHPAKTEITKKVISMVLGLSRYTEDGELIGYSALLRVEL